MPTTSTPIGLNLDDASARVRTGMTFEAAVGIPAGGFSDVTIGAIPRKGNSFMAAGSRFFCPLSWGVLKHSMQQFSVFLKHNAAP